MTLPSSSGTSWPMRSNRPSAQSRSKGGLLSGGSCAALAAA
jgi:hypothetical protein